VPIDATTIDVKYLANRWQKTPQRLCCLLIEGTIPGRRDQAFPALSEREIARLLRFGQRRQYRRGERLFTLESVLRVIVRMEPFKFGGAVLQRGRCGERRP
jgi:hypothetical protein